jgi:hypothetical protein
MTREIRVLSTRDDVAKKFDSDVKTWGELKAQINAIGIDCSGLKAMVRETKITLEDSAATLPEETFTIVLTPDKMKSGK